MPAESLEPSSVPVLEARDLVVTHGARQLVRGVTVRVHAGGTTAIVGESGSGKSLTARAVVGLLPDGLASTGSLTLTGETLDLAAAGPRLDSRWRSVRRSRVALLLQDPFTSLSPVHSVGRQVGWALGPSAGRGRERDAVVRAHLAEVGLAAHVARQYPHELSGGMRQRVAMVLTLAQNPDVLIADEPTTALDSLSQAELLDLIDQVQRRRHMGVVLISHDLDLVSRHSDHIVVMREGDVVEEGPTAQVMGSPRHDYTRALLDAVPKPGGGRGTRSDEMLTVTDLTQHHGERQVLHDVSLTLRRGEIVGLVGQSGSGKTTLARVLAGLQPKSSGEVAWRTGHAAQVSMVFQDPAGTLNPALSVRTTLREALRPTRARRRTAATPESLMDAVGLDRALLDRRPRTLSGGQRQRVAIARALAAEPDLLICDESVSALDVSVQAQILDLLTRLRAERRVSILFISHDLGVIAQISDRMYVLHEGVVVESGDTADVVARPQADYTRQLLAASSIREPDGGSAEG